jgi:hypothetical protein
MTPVLQARRWAVTGSVEGLGGGPAGRAPRMLRAWSQVRGWAGCGVVPWSVSGLPGRAEGGAGRAETAGRPACGYALMGSLSASYGGWQPGTVSSDRPDDHHLTVQMATDLPSK